MTPLHWSDALKLGIGFVDEDHEHAVALMADMQTADGDALVGLLEDFHAHCVAHFGRENEKMEEFGFFAKECHREEHQRVLDELAGVIAKAKDGGTTMATAYARQSLPDWFVRHHASMDTVTSQFLRQNGVS